MIVNCKFFYEKTDADYEEYNKLWDENIERIIFLEINISLTEQIKCIYAEMNNNKDILAVRFPSNSEWRSSNIVNNILFGKGVMYDNNKIWYPKEFWIYCLMPDIKLKFKN